MGNQVLIAIRHDIDRNNIPSFSEVDSLGIHTGERSPKNYEKTGSIIVSHYHHADDKATLIVNNKLMVLAPSFLDIFNKGKEWENDNTIENLIKGYRKRYSSVRKVSKKAQAEPNDGVKVSIFGYLTDRTSEMPENSFALMVDAIDSLTSMDNGKRHICGFAQRLEDTPITLIGSINAEQVAFVELYHNLFCATAQPLNKLETLDSSCGMQERILDFDTKFLKALGYNVVANENDIRWL